MMIYNGYIIDFNNVIEQLNNESYLTKNFQTVQALTKQILSNLIKHPNQLINAIDNANIYLCENGKSNIELINYKNIIGLYYPTLLNQYHKASDCLTEVIINIVWSEYSAQFDNGEYPISETEFTAVLSMILLKITNLITIIPKLNRKK